MCFVVLVCGCCAVVLLNWCVRCAVVLLSCRLVDLTTYFGGAS